MPSEPCHLVLLTAAATVSVILQSAQRSPILTILTILPYSQGSPLRILSHVFKNRQPLYKLAAIIRKCKRVGRDGAVGRTDRVEYELARGLVSVVFDPIGRQNCCVGVFRVACCFGQVCRESVQMTSWWISFCVNQWYNVRHIKTSSDCVHAQVARRVFLYIE